MKPSILILILFFATQVSAMVPDDAAPEGHARCQQLLEQAQAQMSVEDYVTLAEEVTLASEPTIVEITLTQREEEIDILTDLILPKGYAESHQAFLAARERARTVLLPILKRFEEMNQYVKSSMSFSDRLNFIASQYDEVNTKEEKIAVIAQLMRMFSISRERIYMHMITNGSQSKEMKTALYKALTKIFKFDPGWRGPLDRAMKGAGHADVVESMKGKT